MTGSFYGWVGTRKPDAKGKPSLRDLTVFSVEGVLFRTHLGEELYRQVPPYTAFHLETHSTSGELLPRSDWRLAVGDESWRIKWYRLDGHDSQGSPCSSEAP